MAVIKQIKLPSKGSPRRGGGRTQTWETVAVRYQELIEKYHWKYEPMLNLVEAIAASPVAKELYPTTSMSHLLITDTEQFFRGDNVLVIVYDSDKHRFEFEHQTQSGKNDKKSCDEGEAMQTLRLFLKYKFGVLFNPKQARSERGLAS
jgi:hypothetical protein